MLKSEKDYLRILIDNLPDLIYLKDAEGRYVLSNYAHYSSLGAKCEEEILGRTTFDFNPPELAKQYYEDEQQIVKTGKPLICKEEIAYHKNLKKMRWHLTTKIPIKDEEGNVTGLVCISSDITERKEFEEMLKRERNQLKTLIDNLPDMIFFKDVDGKYILNNISHFKSLGVSKQEEVLGKTTYDFNPPELAKQYYDDELQIVKTGEPLLNRVEVAVHKDTGEKRWHQTSKIPIKNEMGRVIGIVGIARDITSQKLAEEERERLIDELRKALNEVKTLRGLIPICANCKKIRDDKGFWTQVETYIQKHSNAEFSHGLCPDCFKLLYPEIYSKQKKSE